MIIWGKVYPEKEGHMYYLFPHPVTVTGAMNTITGVSLIPFEQRLIYLEADSPHFTKVPQKKLKDIL